MSTPYKDRPELRPSGFRGVQGDTVPAPTRPQPQPTGPMPRDGQGGGNNGK